MSIKRHCSGCGKTEPVETTPATIRLTVISVTDWPTESKSEYLCDFCRSAIYRAYFGDEAQFELEPPIPIASLRAERG